MTRAQGRRTIPVIGVTGPIGSGKSTVARIFAGWGGVIVSGDKIGHEVVDRSPSIRRRLAREFGKQVLQDGKLDRAELARRAFATAAGVRKLNSIVHPSLIQELKRQVTIATRKSRARAVVVDAALLVEWGKGRIELDYLVGVSAPYATRARRLRQRGLSATRIRQFARAQMPWHLKRAHCDAIVKNDSTIQILRRRARLCWDKLLSS